jgi:hypothetical protein
MALETSETLHTAAIRVAYVNKFIVLVATLRLKHAPHHPNPSTINSMCYVSPISVHTYIPRRADYLSVHRNMGF